MCYGSKREGQITDDRFRIGLLKDWQEEETWIKEFDFGKKCSGMKVSNSARQIKQYMQSLEEDRTG